MYDKQILVDHFKGKRSADDPEVQREFQRLRQQAQIDWEEMYAGKNRPETPENMAEDYIYNAKLTAETQRKLTKIKWIALLIVFALFCSVLFSVRHADDDRPNFPRLADLYSANLSVSVVPAQDERGRSVTDGKSSDSHDGSRCAIVIKF
jgi:hypothetical protein